MYRARSTLLLQYTDDTLDESADLEEVLREANTIMRMRRPMVEMTVTRVSMRGTHITPLTPDLPPGPADVTASFLRAWREELRLGIDPAGIADSLGVKQWLLNTTDNIDDKGSDDLQVLAQRLRSGSCPDRARSAVRSDWIRDVDNTAGEILRFLGANIHV
jgi:hypothetical protein